MTERILQLYNYVYKQTSSCIESCTVQLWWFHYFLSPLQKALTFLFWSWTWDGSFLILLVLVCIYTCSLWRMYIKQIWSKDNQKRNWHNIPDETNSCLDYLWWRQVPRPPRFLFFGLCSIYYTEAEEGRKTGKAWVRGRCEGAGNYKNKPVSYRSTRVFAILWTSGVLPSDGALDDDV